LSIIDAGQEADESLMQALTVLDDKNQFSAPYNQYLLAPSQYL
jgi:hypothetical protein